jgi:integrase
MPRINRGLPRHVYPIKDRYGNVRYYLRRRGHKDVPMPGLPFSAEMMTAHAAALADAEPISVGARRVVSGSIHAAIGEYLSSSAFVTNRRNGKSKADTTTHKVRWILERFRERTGPNGKRFGDRLLADLQQKHVQIILDEMRDVPASARDLLKALRGLMRWAKRNGRIKVDPTAEVDPPPMKPSDGFPTWEDEHIAQFEARWPVGTKERLALTLFLWTGQRREDIAVMGRQHMRDGVIRLRQIKTSTEVNIPVLADELRNAVAAMPAGQMTFLQTQQGRPFTANGLYNFFKDAMREAGLPESLALHGLRKAFCCHLADAGVDAADIATISGHLTLSMVQRYIKDRNKRAGAVRAMTKLVEYRAAKAGGTK